MVNVLHAAHQDVLRRLLEHRVDFILIGGYAVIAHGYERTTGDMDLWVRPDNSNKLLLLDALKSMDFEEDGLAIIGEADFEQHYAFCLGEQPLRVDFLTRISGVEYEDAALQKIVVEIDWIRLQILHLNHFVLSKINTGRLKDQADIEELQRIAAQRQIKH